jgi:hypothetical protein
MADVAHNFWPFFAEVKSFALHTFVKNVLGYTLGIFFKESSGHAGKQSPNRRKIVQSGHPACFQAMNAAFRSDCRHQYGLTYFALFGAENKLCNRTASTTRGTRGRCYDHNFLRFFLSFGEKIGVFLKYQCHDQLFQNLALL